MTARLRRDSGATLVEYALLVALLLVVSIGAIRNLEDESESKVADRSDGIGQPAEGNALTGPAGGGGGGGGSTGGGGGGGASTVHVGSLTGAAIQSGNNWSATVTVTVLDVNGDPVQGVTATGAWSVGTGGTTCSPTNAAGQCTISSSSFQRTPPAGSVPSVTFTLTSLSGASITYDATANSTNTVTINKP